MTTVREVMHPGYAYVGMDETLIDAAWRIAKPNIGALPVCGEDTRLMGSITDRDIVVKCIAKRKNPAEARTGDLIEEPHLWWIDADADIDDVLHEMAEHKIRRLPVLENKELVGIISQADLALKLPNTRSVSWCTPSPVLRSERRGMTYPQPRAQRKGGETVSNIEHTPESEEPQAQPAAEEQPAEEPAAEEPTGESEAQGEGGTETTGGE